LILLKIYWGENKCNNKIISKGFNSLFKNETIELCLKRIIFYKSESSCIDKIISIIITFTAVFLDVPRNICRLMFKEKNKEILSCIDFLVFIHTCLAFIIYILPIITNYLPYEILKYLFHTKNKMFAIILIYFIWRLSFSIIDKISILLSSNLDKNIKLPEKIKINRFIEIQKKIKNSENRCFFQKYYKIRTGKYIILSNKLNITPDDKIKIFKILKNDIFPNVPFESFSRTFIIFFLNILEFIFIFSFLFNYYNVFSNIKNNELILNLLYVTQAFIGFDYNLNSINKYPIQLFLIAVCMFSSFIFIVFLISNIFNLKYKSTDDNEGS